jgi:hypothetical protein
MDERHVFCEVHSGAIYRGLVVEWPVESVERVSGVTIELKQHRATESPSLEADIKQRKLKTEDVACAAVTVMCVFALQMFHNSSCRSSDHPQSVQSSGAFI